MLSAFAYVSLQEYHKGRLCKPATFGSLGEPGPCPHHPQANERDASQAPAIPPPCSCCRRPGVHHVPTVPGDPQAVPGRHHSWHQVCPGGGGWRTRTARSVAPRQQPWASSRSLATDVSRIASQPCKLYYLSPLAPYVALRPASGGPGHLVCPPSPQPPPPSSPPAAVPCAPSTYGTWRRVPCPRCTKQRDRTPRWAARHWRPHAQQQAAACACWRARLGCVEGGRAAGGGTPAGTS